MSDSNKTEPWKYVLMRRPSDRALALAAQDKLHTRVHTYTLAALVMVLAVVAFVGAMWQLSQDQPLIGFGLIMVTAGFAWLGQAMLFGCAGVRGHFHGAYSTVDCIESVAAWQERVDQEHAEMARPLGPLTDERRVEYTKLATEHLLATDYLRQLRARMEQLASEHDLGFEEVPQPGWDMQVPLDTGGLNDLALVLEDHGYQQVAALVQARTNLGKGMHLRLAWEQDDEAPASASV